MGQTIFYANEYLSRPGHVPSVGITLNLACAYGQSAAKITDRSARAFLEARERALQALRDTLAIRSDAKARIRELMHPAPGDEDGDLAVFAGDQELEALIA